MTPAATAVVLTVGNEIVFGDVENTNASWLARRLAELGLEVRLLAAVRDSVEEVAAFLRAEMGRVAVVIVTGRSLSVVPGWNPVVRQRASMPVERVTAPSGEFTNTEGSSGGN